MVRRSRRGGGGHLADERRVVLAVINLRGAGHVRAVDLRRTVRTKEER